MNPVQQKRYEAKTALGRALNALGGVPGLTTEEYVAKLNEATAAIAEANEAVAQATILTAAREDLDAYRAEKGTAVEPTVDADAFDEAVDA
jgi:hypothetical protein